MPEDAPLLLFVDFDGLRTGAAASELPLRPNEAEVDLVPLPGPADLPSEASPSSYSKWLLERVQEPPAALVGYCVGASIAVQLAERIEDRHGRPQTVILIDPAEASETGVWEETNMLLSRLHAAGLPDRGGLDVAEAVRELEAAYGRYLEEQDPDDREMLLEMREETMDRYAAWLAFVAAASGRAEGRMKSPLHVLFSVEGDRAGLPRWLEAPATATRLDVRRDDLLASREAAEALVRLADLP